MTQPGRVNFQFVMFSEEKKNGGMHGSNEMSEKTRKKLSDCRDCALFTVAFPMLGKYMAQSISIMKIFC